MRAVLIEKNPKMEWRAGLDAVVSELGAVVGWTLVRRDLPDPSADTHLLCAGDSGEYLPLLASFDHAQRRRTVLVGVNLEWRQGAYHHEPGSLPHLLETQSLGGAFTGPALVAWRELPSYFAGPKELMDRFATNCIKAMQSESYCVWGRARGASLPAFLIEFLPALCAHARPGPG